MSERNWTVESVTFEDASAYPEFLWAENLPPGSKVATLIGKTADGRLFYNKMALTAEFWNDQGEEKCVEFMRDIAQPPKGEP